MGGLFNYDSALMTGFRKVANILAVSILWLVFCLPVITVGASTSALYYAIHKNLKYDRSYAWKSFWTGFKTSFKQATAVWLVMLAIALLLGIDLYILHLYSTGELIFLNRYAEIFKWLQYCTVPFYIILIVELGYFLYVFPYIARFKASLKVIVKNCFILMIRHLLFTILMIGISLLSLLLIWMVPVLILFLPTLSLWVISYMMEKLYRRYMSEEMKAEEDERNRLKV